MNSVTLVFGRMNILILISLAAFLLWFLCSSPLAGQESCTRLLTNRCEVCHYLTRVCGKVDRERKRKSWFGSSEGKWKQTINNMVKQGAQVNAAEKEILVGCLSEPASEVLNLCQLDE